MRRKKKKTNGRKNDSPPDGVSTRFQDLLGGEKKLNALTPDKLNECMIDYAMRVEDGPLAWWICASTRVGHQAIMINRTSAYFFFDGRYVYGVKAWTQWMPRFQTRIGCVSIYPIDATLDDAKNFKRLPMVEGTIAPLDTNRNVVEYMRLKSPNRTGLAQHASSKPTRRLIRVRDSCVYMTQSDPWINIFKRIASSLPRDLAEEMRLSREELVRASTGYERSMFLSSHSEIEKVVREAAPPQCEACGAGAMGEGSGEDDGASAPLKICTQCKLAYVCDNPRCKEIHATCCVSPQRPHALLRAEAI